jgi:hypothetical protein
MITPVFHGKIEHGKLKLEQRREFDLYCCRLEGKAVDLVLEKHKTTRSNQQSRYLNGVVYKIIADELGYSRDQVHDLLRYKFLRKEDGRTPGLYTITSTAKLSKDEFSEYIEEIKKFSMEFLNCYIPSPDEVEV